MDGIENDENVSRIMGIDSKIYENIIRLESKIDRLASSLNSFTTYQEKFNGTVSDDMDILKRDVNILHGFKTRVTAIISTIAFIVTIISNQIVSFFTDNRS